MLNRLADLVRPRAARDEGVRGVSPAAGLDDLSRLPVGTELQAKVAAALPNRVYQVMIGDRAYTLALPLDAHPGDEIQLTVVEGDARFSPPRPERAVQAQGGAVTILSPTARFITTLLSASPRLLLSGPEHPAAPLITAPPRDPAVVATRLSQALAASGMFYESHQAQWVEGNRSLAQLMLEPQARVAPLPPPVADPAGADSPLAFGGKATAAVEPLVHPALLSMVRDQLEALSTLRLSWHGQIWPGQDLCWEITEHTPRQGSRTDAAGGGWQTRLTLTLPRLGEVSAVVSVGAAGVDIALSAANDATRSAMKAGGVILRSALSQAGLRPSSFRINSSMVDHG